MTKEARPRVVLADDHPGILAALERLLAPDCDIVGSVDNGEAVCDACRRLQPDVLVLDLNMPGLGGLEVCRQSVQAASPVQVILLSADTSAPVRERAISLGAFAVVAKYQVADLLLPRIKDAIRESTRTGRP
jgi:two-component system invasion response regulator UvrY